jgi:hypothetical protein
MGTCLDMVVRPLDRRLPVWPRKSVASRLEIGQARILLITLAVWLSACDLIVKLIEPTETGLYHRRTYFELVFILVVTAAAIYVVPYARSRMITVGAGLMVGGGFGNALSIAIFPLGVPNPFSVSQSGWTIAFNLADIAVATGFVLATIGVWRLGSEHRHELLSPVER